MRRLLAILLLAAFGLPAVAPLLAFGQDPETSLPICCRRGGSHHCNQGTRPTDTPAFTSICPSFPQSSATTPHAPVTALLVAHPTHRLPIATPSAPQRAETQRRLSRERTRQERGPPAALLVA